MQRHKTRGAEEQYKEMRKLEKGIHRKKKNKYFEEQMKQVEHGEKGRRRMY